MSKQESYWTGYRASHAPNLQTQVSSIQKEFLTTEAVGGRVGNTGEAVRGRVGDTGEAVGGRVGDTGVQAAPRWTYSHSLLSNHLESFIKPFMYLYIKPSVKPFIIPAN